jgi:uncharacterized surface protein with fasciclin (FAS1) repeats
MIPIPNQPLKQEKQMKFRIAIAAILATTLVLPASASAWWWKDKEQESIVDVALDVNENVVPGAFDILLELVVSQPSVFKRLDSKYRRTTVFAPTDDAFEDLFALVSSELCLEPEDYPAWYVKDVLNYHLSYGTKDSGDVFGAGKVRMQFGGYVFPDSGDLSLADNLTNSLGVANSGIVAPYFDVEADNGVIHVIDRVLVPYLPPSACE